MLFLWPVFTCLSNGIDKHEMPSEILLIITLLITDVLRMFRVTFAAQEFGLFLSDDDPKKGVWLDNSRSLEYYLLRNGVSLRPDINDNTKFLDTS